MLAYCLCLGDLLLQPMQFHEELGGPAFTQVSPLVMAAPAPTSTFWAGSLQC